MMRESPFNPIWKKMGASFCVDNGWRIPARFTDPKTELKAFEKNGALFDQSSRGKIKITGNDRTGFLHNILTNDIESLSVGESCQAALLSHKGQALMTMNVMIFSDHIWLDVEPNYEKKLVLLLEKYLITEDVEIVDVTNEYGMLQEGLKRPPLIVPNQEIESIIHKILEKSEIQPVGHDLYEYLRIREGLLCYGKDITEETLLNETGLDEVMASESKGCYPGQEVVARIRTYDGLKRKVVRFSAEDAAGIQAGNKILRNEKEVGWITSVNQLFPSEAAVMLGVLAKEALSEVSFKLRTEKGETRNICQIL